MTKDLYFLGFLWLVWCVLHSILISVSQNRFLKFYTGKRSRFHRLFYNLFSIATLIPILIYGRSLTGMPLFQWDGLLSLIRYIFLLLSIALFFAGARHYNMLYFLGIQQIKSGEAREQDNFQHKISRGDIYRFIRHPWYLGGILIVWTWQKDIDMAGLLINSILSLYFIIGAFIEEKRMVKRYGGTYLNYCSESSMFFPVKYIAKKVFKDPI